MVQAEEVQPLAQQRPQLRVVLKANPNTSSSPSHNLPRPPGGFFHSLVKQIFPTAQPTTQPDRLVQEKEVVEEEEEDLDPPNRHSGRRSNLSR
jgi:hypothetical protein